MSEHQSGWDNTPRDPIELLDQMMRGLDAGSGRISGRRVMGFAVNTWALGRVMESSRPMRRGNSDANASGHKNENGNWNNEADGGNERWWMMGESKIEWTEKTWEVTAGCTKVSSGCANCYAETLVAGRLCGVAKRRERDGVANGKPLDLSLKVINPETRKWNGHIEMLPMNLEQPLKRKKPTVYFVNSRSDLFHPDVSIEYICKVFAVMALCPQHRFQVLTKRTERMCDVLGRGSIMDLVPGIAEDLFFRFGLGIAWEQVLDLRERLMASAGRSPCLPNVWLGTSVENQAVADERIPHLLKCPVGVGAGRFLSVEPLLGAVDLSNVAIKYGIGVHIIDCLKLDVAPEEDEDYGGATIHWVIVGGESGGDARMCNVAWIRSIVEQCQSARVPVFVKQLGKFSFIDDGMVEVCEAGNKGERVEMFPEDLRVRQVPDGLKIGDGQREDREGLEEEQKGCEVAS